MNRAKNFHFADEETGLARPPPPPPPPRQVHSVNNAVKLDLNPGLSDSKVDANILGAVKRKEVGREDDLSSSLP